MKQVVFGLSVSSSWGNGHATLWRGLCPALARMGNRVVFFERGVPYYASHRDLTDLSGGCDLILYSDWPHVLPAATGTASEAIAALNRDPEDGDRIGRAARERMLSEHTASIRASQLEKFWMPGSSREGDRLPWRPSNMWGITPAAVGAMEGYFDAVRTLAQPEDEAAASWSGL